MRHAAFWLGLIMLAPVGHALVTPPTLQVPDLDPLPVDIKDADVLMLLAPHWDVTPTRLPLIEADLSREPLSTSITRLAALGGFTLAPADAYAYDALDPSVKLPVATLALTIERAWLMVDASFASWTQEEIQASILAMRAGYEPTKVLSPGQKESLVNAAILLTDTIESLVIPQLQAAAHNGAWPATPVADPVGVLRVGGTGNDVDPLDRILTIDARGNDTYYGNAGGGSAWVNDVDKRRLVAVAIDLSGNDVYDQARQHASYGAAEYGLGAFYDLAGNDSFEPQGRSMGTAAVGIGVFRDVGGRDTHLGGSYTSGSASTGIGYARDDEGDDIWATGGGRVGGYGVGQALGIFWDRSGMDEYRSLAGTTDLWGYGLNGGKGWFVDEGSGADRWYYTFTGAPHPVACNDCIWSQGNPTATGRGNDNRGGLAYLIAAQDP